MPAGEAVGSFVEASGGCKKYKTTWRLGSREFLWMTVAQVIRPPEIRPVCAKKPSQVFHPYSHLAHPLLYSPISDDARPDAWLGRIQFQPPHRRNLIAAQFVP